MATYLKDLIETLNAEDIPTNIFTIEDDDPNVILGKLNEVISNLETLNSTINASDSKADEALQRAIQAVADATQALSVSNGIDAKATQALANAIEAVGTANTALSAGNTALSTANTAISTANTALSSANSAVETAEDALDTAESAETKADTAITTANGAKTTAEGIDAKATTALSNSQTAVSTSSTAETKAQEALDQVVSGLGTKVYRDTTLLSSLDIKPIEDDIEEKAFNKVYKSLSDLTGIDASSTLAQVCDAMVDNSYLNVSTSGYANLVPTGETDLNGQLEIIKVNANRVRLAWSYQNAARQPIYFATYRNAGGFLGWKRMITDSDEQTITGLKNFDYEKIKISVNNNNNDYRHPLTSPYATTKDKRLLLGVPALQSPYTNYNSNVYMENGKLYSNNSEVVNDSDNQTIDGTKTFAKPLKLKNTDNAYNDTPSNVTSRSFYFTDKNDANMANINSTIGSTWNALNFQLNGKNNVATTIEYVCSGNDTDGYIWRFNPVTHNLVDLGSRSRRWKDLYLSGNLSNGTYNYSMPTKSGTLATLDDIKFKTYTYTQMILNSAIQPVNGNRYEITFDLYSTIPSNAIITGINGSVSMASNIASGDFREIPVYIHGEAIPGYQTAIGYYESTSPPSPDAKHNFYITVTFIV